MNATKALSECARLGNPKARAKVDERIHSYMEHVGNAESNKCERRPSGPEAEI